MALVEVTEAGAGRSRARLATVLRPDVPVEPGAPAVLVSSGDLRVRVAFLDGADRPPLAAVAARLAGPEPSGFVALAPAGAIPDFFLALTPEGGVEVRDAAGEPLTALPGAFGPDAVVAALEHLARFRNVQALDNPDPGSDLYKALGVSLDRLPGPWRPREPLGPQPFQVQPPCVRPGDWLCLTLENRSVRELNVAVLDLQADWSIRQAYPAGSLRASGCGACRRLPFEGLAGPSASHAGGISSRSSPPPAPWTSAG